jgi:pyridine nucleotide-disulfide oxidoreductase family protein
MPGRRLVLVGGGHAHVQVLHALSGPAVDLTLVSDVSLAPYSGMLPGHLAGHYEERDLVFDLAAICERRGHRFIQQAATLIDPEARLLTLGDGTRLDYDVCSLNVGIVPQTIGVSAAVPTVIYVKPISNFLAQWRAATALLPAAGPVVIIGGGAAAFELAIACGLRFPGRVSLVTGADGLTLPTGAATHARAALGDLGIELLEGQRVERIEAGRVYFSRGSKSFALALVAITARAGDLIEQSSLPKGPEGHVIVDEFLRVQGRSTLFAAGDCAHFAERVLPKAGVYAVRQGPILAHNLRSALSAGGDLARYVPQKSALSILITGRDDALICWRGLALRSRWAARLKDRIDRRFMRKFA